jgi:hypothetical protein
MKSAIEILESFRKIDMIDADGEIYAVVTFNDALKAIEMYGSQFPVSGGCAQEALGGDAEWRTEMFKLFWDKYNKKVGRQRAERAWKKLKRADIWKIIETVEAFKNYKPFENYVHPNPEAYINGRRWEDEIPTANTRKHSVLSEITTHKNTWSYGG